MLTRIYQCVQHCTYIERLLLFACVPPTPPPPPFQLNHMSVALMQVEDQLESQQPLDAHLQRLAQACQGDALVEAAVKSVWEGVNLDLFVSCLL